MVWLPGKQKYYCIGSNGATSQELDTDAMGCGYLTSHSCPGCPADPTANGN